jgi:hypothetical protein
MEPWEIYCGTGWRPIPPRPQVLTLGSYVSQPAALQGAAGGGALR